MDEIFIKKAEFNILKELKTIGFDKSYMETAQKKYKGNAYKIFNLKPFEANILKQICLSLGFDCAVNRNTVTCNCEKTDCLIFATEAQYEILIEKLEKQPFRLKKISQLLKDVINKKLTPLKIRNTIFDWKRPYIMGILNITPDSFSDGGKYNDIDKAIIQCEKLIKEGADIIDIGGESTRPGAKPVLIDEEINRVIPVIEKIRTINKDIVLSIDTRNYTTAKAAIEAGSDIINDVTGLDYDKNLFEYVTEKNVPTIIMHSNKVPAIKYNTYEGNIIEEIYRFFEIKINKMINEGMERKNIIIDTGIGFGKASEENFEILRRINEFKSLNTPILIGISRKSFLRETFNVEIEEADLPTALYSAMLADVNIHRVHNVGLVRKYLEYAKSIL